MQGVIKAYDPDTKLGSLIRDSDMAELALATDALDNSLFRFLRQGQRVNFDLNEGGLVTKVRFGSEPDMRTV